MLVNELRKDYLLDRWVVIAAQRKKRPKDYSEKFRGEGAAAACPFCPGNEHMTPPASLIYLIMNGELKKSRDENESRCRNWIVRCIPNLYPAFTPPLEESSQIETSLNGIFISAKAIGHHEVVIESPNHDEHPSSARLEQLIHVINALKDRVGYFIQKSYVKYVSIFRNYGADAGASLSHAHSQIIAAPIIPKTPKEESYASGKYYAENGKCIFCEIIGKEMGSERFIWGNNNFIVFSPWASINPFEFWIFPKRHQSTILDITTDEVKSLAEALRVSLGGLKRLLNDPSYNLGFHMIPERHYHWHIEVYPCLSTWAGFEKSTGAYINIVSPEEAAESLREPFREEEKSIKG